MQPHELQLPRVILLALLALALGAVALQIDSGRRATSAASAASLVPAVQSASPLEAALSPPGQTVSQPAPAASTTPDVTPVEAVATERVAGIQCASPHRTVQISARTPVRAAPGGRAVGAVPSTSVYMGTPMTAWVQDTSADGRWGRVSVPWANPVGRSGWIDLSGLSGRTTSTMLVADLSERTLRVFDGCVERFSVSTAIGRAGSPSPTGRFWVTDRIPVPSAQRQSFGSFAFGLSAVQPNLPAGWTGGDQMAIHGTGAPGSIGQAASAGCLRISEASLARLRPLLAAGTPVIIRA